MSSGLRLSLLAIATIALVLAAITRAESNGFGETKSIGMIEAPPTDLAGIRCEDDERL